jgi:regulatory protein
VAVGSQARLELTTDNSKLDCYAAALRILSYRFNSEAELRRKLKRKGFEESAIDETLARLREENWLDDERFAGALVRTRASKRVGRLRIRRELDAAGVEKEAAARALDENLDAERERTLLFEACRKRASLLVRRGGEDYVNSEEGKAKLAAWLIARGYDAASVWDVIRSITTGR